MIEQTGVVPGPPVDTDELLSDLLVASGDHDQGAFARFYQLTSPWIFDLMSRRSGSSNRSAEDATVSVYVAGWQRAASFAPLEQSALVWLTAIAHELTRAARRDALVPIGSPNVAGTGGPRAGASPLTGARISSLSGPSSDADAGGGRPAHGVASR